MRRRCFPNRGPQVCPTGSSISPPYRHRNSQNVSQRNICNCVRRTVKYKLRSYVVEITRTANKLGTRGYEDIGNKTIYAFFNDMRKGFFTFVYTKCKYVSHLRVESDLRIRLSNIDSSRTDLVPMKPHHPLNRNFLIEYTNYIYWFIFAYKFNFVLRKHMYLINRVKLLLLIFIFIKGRVFFISVWKKSLGNSRKFHKHKRGKRVVDSRSFRGVSAPTVGFNTIHRRFDLLSYIVWYSTTLQCSVKFYPFSVYASIGVFIVYHLISETFKAGAYSDIFSGVGQNIFSK